MHPLCPCQMKLVHKVFRSSEKPMVLHVAPGVMTIFGDLIEERKAGFRKQEPSSCVKRFVDDRVA